MPFRWIRRGILLAIAAFSLASVAGAVSPEPSADERARIEAIIHDYLMANPDVIMESLRAHEAQRREQAAREGALALTQLRPEIESGEQAPVAGNASGDVTIVEFFDYQCGYCKRVLPTVQEMLKTDKKVRLVLREFPILGPESVAAAKIALAVWTVAPNKYFDFHAQLMQARGTIGEERALKVAEGLGLDIRTLRAAAADPAIDTRLRRNLELGQAIDVNGTPAFVIDGELVPGAIDLATLRQLIASARAG